MVLVRVSAAAGPAWVDLPDGHRPGQPAYRRLLVGLMAGGLANFVLLYYVQPLLPSLAARYGVSAGTSAQALSVTTVAMAVAFLVVGPLSDAVGRVALLRWSLVASGLLGVASAYAPSWEVLLVLRGLLGVALAGLPALALAYLREEVHRSAHLRVNAGYIAGTAMGGAAGRLLPGPLDHWWGWQGTTLVVSGLTLLAAVLVWLLVPPSLRFVPARPGVRALAGNTVRTVRDPVLVALCLVGGTTMGAFVGLYNAVAFRLTGPPFLLGGAASAVYLPYLLGLAAPAVASRVAAGAGRGVAVLAGLALFAVGVLVTAVPTLASVMAGLGLLTFAFLGVHSLATGWVVDRARRVRVGAAQASSSYLLAYYAGSAVFGVLTTSAWEAGGWTVVVTVSLGLVVAGATAAVTAGRRDRP